MSVLSYRHMTVTDYMIFQINYKAGKAVYLQLVEQVKVAIASGVLQAGDALPSIRPLAEELRVNRNTIAKAYQELESQGAIETLAGKGCFVRAGSSPLRKDIRLKLLSDRMDDAVVHAHHLRIGRAEFLRLAEERFDSLEVQRERALAIHTPS